MSLLERLKEMMQTTTNTEQDELVDGNCEIENACDAEVEDVHEENNKAEE